MFIPAMAMAKSAASLTGFWVGTIHQHRTVRTTWHQADYDTVMTVSFEIGDDEQVVGQGAAQIATPVVSAQDYMEGAIGHVDWSATETPSAVNVSIEGYVPTSRTVLWLGFKPTAPLTIQAHYIPRSQSPFDKPYDKTLEDDGTSFPDSVPLRTNPPGIGAFSQHVHKGQRTNTGMDLPSDVIYANEDALFEDIDLDGRLVRPLTAPKQAMLALAALLSLLGFIGAYLKQWFGSKGSGIAWALAGAVFGTVEKLREWGVLQSSVNPTTGLPIAGSHLQYPWAGLGRMAQGVGAGIAIASQFQESYDIWRSEGSLANRVTRETISLGINALTTGASIALVTVTAETGPGLALGFAGASALGVGGEYVKQGLQRWVNKHY